MIIKMKNEADTAAYGKKLAAELEPGDIICLVGELGTGKTALTKAIAEGLGVTEQIVSPTFNIVKEYHTGRLPLYHFDVYRVSDSSSLFEIGIDEYFNGSGVCIVEWADLIPDMIPDGSRLINIYYGDSDGERIYDIDIV